jgi:hypothetical protein
VAAEHSLFGLPAADRAFWSGLAEALDPTPDPYWDDPVQWGIDKLGIDPAFYQSEAMSWLAETHRVCIRGPHGLGKTAMASWLILWFADTREKAGKDWKVVTTASVWRQLQKYLWPEIHKWGDKLGYTRFELLSLELKLKYGQAFPVASDDEMNIEGAHADEILYIIDEGKNVPAATWDAIEGALSTGQAYAFAMSTPGAPAGRFYEIQTRKPGTEDWKVLHVTKDMAIKAGRMNAAWAEQRRKQWGEDDPRYKNRVLGEFSTVDESVVIPLEWVEHAQTLWQDFMDKVEAGEATLPPFEVLSVDVARLGSDNSVFAYRHGRNFIDELEVIAKITTDILSARIHRVLKRWGGRAVVDAIGIGAGVLDNVRATGAVVDAFVASARTELLDTSGELGFLNRRAGAWWGLRELLDPDRHYGIMLPPDDELVGELTTVRWREAPGNKIQIEGKDEIRKRIGRSTDRADAVVMAFAIEEGEPDNEEGMFVEDWEGVGGVSPY